MNSNVFLLPHQDDEAFIIASVLEYQRAGDQNYFFYLTSQKDQSLDESRNNETLSFLKSIGVSKNVIFIGTDLKVFDSELVYSINSMCLEIEKKISNLPNVHVISPILEGGHVDHDSAFIISQRLSKKFNLNVSYYTTYNGLFTKSKFFRVMKANLYFQTFKKYKIKWSEMSHFIFMPLYFPTQWKSWLGIFPEYILKIIVQRHQVLYKKTDAFNLDNIFDSMFKDSVPLYERWERFTLEKFKDLIKD